MLTDLPVQQHRLGSGHAPAAHSNLELLRPPGMMVRREPE